MKTLPALLLLLSFALTYAAAQTKPNQPGQHATEIAAEYSYEHANAPPAGCGCFSLNGGSVSIAEPIRSGHVSFAFDTTIAHGAAGPYGLTLSTFTAGVRYRPLPQGRWNPFSEVLVGASHASGALASGTAPAATNPALVFASTLGGGLDRRLSSRWSLRLIQADYLITTFTNGGNNHQNIARISSGFTFRLSK